MAKVDSNTQTSSSSSSSSSSLAVSKDDDEYIQTTTHNYVSRQAVIEGARQVELKGRGIIERGCHLDGRQAWIRIQRYTHLQANTRITPPTLPGSTKHVPVSIGSHTMLGHDCQIEAAAIGSHCWIGNHVKLGKRVIIKDCCIVADHVVLGDDTVIAPFTRISDQNNSTTSATGSPLWTPPNYVELPPSTALEMQERTMETYQAFVKQQASK